MHPDWNLQAVLRQLPYAYNRKAAPGCSPGAAAWCCRRSGCFDCIPGGTGRIEKTGKDTGVKKFGAELWASKKAGPLRVGAEGQPFV